MSYPFPEPEPQPQPGPEPREDTTSPPTYGGSGDLFAPPAAPPPGPGPQPYPAYFQPGPLVDPRPATNPWATTGLVLGIIGAVLFWVPVVNFILATLAIIFGAIGWAKSRTVLTGRKMGIAGVILGVVTMVGWFVFWAAVLGAAGTGTAGAIAAIPTTAATSTSSATFSSDTATDAAPAVADPTTADYRVTLKITSKDCGGGDGYLAAYCFVDYKTDLTWIGATADKPSEGTSYDVTYTVKGCKDGAVDDTITTTDGKYDRGFGGCETGKPPKLTVKVTDVTRNS